MPNFHFVLQITQKMLVGCATHSMMKQIPTPILKQHAWQYFSTNTNTHSNDNDDERNDKLRLDDSRKSKCDPNESIRIFSDRFRTFKRANSVNELSDTIEKETHWIGWMRIDSYDDITRFLWIYTHQTKIVYNIRGEHKVNLNPTVLTFRQWFNDETMIDEKVQHVSSHRSDCQRLQLREKGAANAPNNPKHFSTKTNRTNQIRYL